MTTENNSISNSAENQANSAPSATSPAVVTKGKLIISSSLVPPGQPKPVVLAPGQWARVVLGFEAPFGFDHMPTVLG